MRKKYILIAGIVVLVLVAAGAGWGWYLYNKPHQGVNSETASARLEAKNLYAAFQTDENKANGQYLGKVVEVKGKISAKTSGSLQLSCGDAATGGINCSLAPGQTLPGTDSSAIVTIKGRCTGYLMDVNLVDCIIEQIEQ
ncbi:MAG TPA: hypothetical protein VL547_14380 [Dinghuibacter sp.]|jgi:hypothetical protein|uniref:OB-fold protein n=1 Tax=Dinghuibacter sp. TaxID=2024697 RepID=UPI002CD68A37|nr:hypothetical protein [Dinghuibacter sp.]HTJ13218.1 hypothetical protein [Dinghuibacter sp.]